MGVCFCLGRAFRPLPGGLSADLGHRCFIIEGNFFSRFYRTGQSDHRWINQTYLKNYTDDCAFYEKLLKQYYTTFYSNRYKKERNQTWYISIDRRGRPRKGARSNEHQPRVQFLPLDADLDLIKQIEHQQRTKTGSNTSATTSIDAIRTVQPLPSSGVTTPEPPPLLPDTTRCTGKECRKPDKRRRRRRRRRCRRKQKGKRRRCKKRKRRKRRRKKHSDGSVVDPTGLQTLDASSVVNLGKGGGVKEKQRVKEGEGTKEGKEEEGSEEMLPLLS